MVEIVLIQRFLLYFGNPIHAAAAVISGLLTGTADQEIPWAWGINGCLSVVSTVLATVIALELGFVWAIVLTTFVYCMTFLKGGGQDCSARKPSGASIPSVVRHK